ADREQRAMQHGSHAVVADEGVGDSEGRWTERIVPAVGILHREESVLEGVERAMHARLVLAEAGGDLSELRALAVELRKADQDAERTVDAVDRAGAFVQRGDDELV